MSTPEHPADKPLTRRQLREIRNTGSTPVVGPQDAATGDAAADVESTAPEPTPPAPRLPRPAPPAGVSPAPEPDGDVNLGVSPLTRRQARQQEKIRTASVPVITPEIAQRAASPGAEQPVWTAAPVDPALGEPTPIVAAVPDAEAEADRPDSSSAVDVAETAREDEDAASASSGESVEREESPAERPVVNPAFGAGLLAGAGSGGSAAPASFDQLLSRSSSGSATTPNALIMSQTPSTLASPIASTGEVLITGSYNLPEGFGSTGHARGTADGKEADAVLVDGELPAHSSPTPIAASAAISTAKSPGEVIKPPTPEKSGRLMLALAITAGVLALALVGVLILAFVTGAI